MQAKNTIIAIIVIVALSVGIWKGRQIIQEQLQVEMERQAYYELIEKAEEENESEINQLVRYKEFEEQ